MELHCEFCTRAIAHGDLRLRVVEGRMVPLCPACTALFSERARHPPPRLRIELIGLMAIFVLCVLGSFVVVFLE